MERFTELTDKIKKLKDARQILHDEYQRSDFHKKKEENPQDMVPPSPSDEETIKLLTAIHQIDNYIKKLQEEQFKVLKDKESN